MSARGTRRTSILCALALTFASAFASASLVAGCDEELDESPDGDDADASVANDAPPGLPRSDGAAPAPDSATCNATACAPGAYRGVVSLAACCAPSGACGLDLLPLGALLPVPTSCTELAAPGSPSIDCIGVEIERDGAAPLVHGGCCRPNGACGISVKLDELDFGCQAPEDFLADYDAALVPCTFDAGADASFDAGPDAGADADTDADAGS